MNNTYKTEDSLLIYLNFPRGVFDDPKKLAAVLDLQDILTEVLDVSGVGYCDGNEFCEGSDETSVTFFLYGRDAQELYQTVEPVLSFLPKLSGSYVLKRFSNNSEEKHIFL